MKNLNVRNRLRCRDLIAVLFMGFVIGCSTINSLPSNNILMFDAGGTPVDPCSFAETKNADTGVCDKVSPTAGPRQYDSLNDYDAYLDRMLLAMDKYFQGKEKKKILLFVHGGLNSRGGSLERVVEEKWGGRPLYEEIMEDGQYPIFINWHSGLFSTYGDHLFNIRQGEDWGWLGYLTAPVYLGVDLLRSVSRAPMVWTSMAMDEAKTSPVLSSVFDDQDSVQVANDIDCRNKFGTASFKADVCKQMANKPVPDKFSIATGSDQRSTWDMALAGAQSLVTFPSRLVVAPVLDGVGTSSWNNMLRRVNLLYHVDDEFHTRSSLSQSSRKNDQLGLSRVPASGGLSRFMEKFIQKYGSGFKANPGDWEITLVGHSMGTIVLNEMIGDYGVIPNETLRRLIDVPEKDNAPLILPFKRIVYMASASTVRHYEDRVIPYLIQNECAQFYNLMLNRMAEIRETNALGLSPRGSLLVWIDDFLSNPLTHRDKTLGRFDNFLVTVHDTPESVKDRIHIKTFSTGSPVNGREPEAHGDFGNLKFWDDQCWEAYPANGRDDCYRKD